MSEFIYSFPQKGPMVARSQIKVINIPGGKPSTSLFWNKTLRNKIYRPLNRRNCRYRLTLSFFIEDFLKKDKEKQYILYILKRNNT